MKNRVGLDHSTKPVVVVDWHHTLEVEEEVSGRNSYALEMLTKVANETAKCWQTYKLPQAEWTSTITQPMHQKLARFSPRL